MKDLLLFPAPRVFKPGKKRCDYSDFSWVVLPPECSFNLKSKFEGFASECRTGFTRGLKATAGRPSHGSVFLTAAFKKGIPEQGYEMGGSAEGVRLFASDEAGMFYGLQTLRQMVGQRGARLMDFEIKDSPSLRSRGYMLDISRCKVPTMATLRRYVETLAAMKINQLQLYTEHTFEFAAHGTVWRDSSPMTAGEIMTLDGWCREHYIELVPNFNSFGHLGRWLMHPEYKHMAECPDGYEAAWGKYKHGGVLKPNKDSLKFLDALYEEMLPNFTSKNFNVGCDETVELGMGWSRQACEKRGRTRVYLDFLLEINKLVKKHGRRMMFWGDIILHEPQYVKELPKDIIALNWWYENDKRFDETNPKLAEAGVPFYVCPGTSSWNTLVGRTENSLGNIFKALDSCARHGGEGFLNTDWGDNGHHQYPCVSMLGIFAGAAYSWAPAQNKDVDLAGALDTLAFQDDAGVAGELLFNLGNVYRLIREPSSNCTHFNSFLFRNLETISKDKGLQKVAKGDLEKSLKRLGELEEMLPDCRMACPDAAIVAAEIRNGVRMAKLGCMKGVMTKGGKVDKAAMRRELGEIISAHEDLWLARNRRGGLRESSDNLRKVFEDLK